ncbi:hypothetical protein NHQ30_011568 [Ciborinia camelliae]|nr:hypothetical protein NHQ30_011568 [Ciborinia camelliae]
MHPLPQALTNYENTHDEWRLGIWPERLINVNQPVPKIPEAEKESPPLDVNAIIELRERAVQHERGQAWICNDPIPQEIFTTEAFMLEQSRYVERIQELRKELKLGSMGLDGPDPTTPDEMFVLEQRVTMEISRSQRLEFLQHRLWQELYRKVEGWKLIEKMDKVPEWTHGEMKKIKEEDIEIGDDLLDEMEMIKEEDVEKGNGLLDEMDDRTKRRKERLDLRKKKMDMRSEYTNMTNSAASKARREREEMNAEVSKRTNEALEEAKKKQEGQEMLVKSIELAFEELMFDDPNPAEKSMDSLLVDESGYDGEGESDGETDAKRISDRKMEDSSIWTWIRGRSERRVG